MSNSTHTTFEFSSNALHSSRKRRESFASLMSVSRSSKNGRTMILAVSPDGKSIALVVSDDEKQSISVRPVGGVEMKKIVASEAFLISGLTISPDNRFVSIAATQILQTQAQPNFFRANSSFSPDGKSIACYYGGGWQLAILSFETGKVIHVINPPNTYNAQTPPGRPLGRSNDGGSIYYLNAIKAAYRIFTRSVWRTEIRRWR